MSSQDILNQHALINCQKVRDEIRAERDAALAEVARLRNLVVVEALPILTIEQVNALPEARDKWWPAGVNDAFVRVLKAALTEQRRQHARAINDIFAAS